MAEPFLTEPNVPIWKIHFDLIVVVLRTPAVSSSIVKNQLEIKAYQTINLKATDEATNTQAKSSELFGKRWHFTTQHTLWEIADW